MNNTTNLSSIGYSNYNLSIEGKLYKNETAPKEIQRDKNNRFYIIADNGRGYKVSLKTLYRKVYNKEFCIDNISNLINEKWKEIQDTNGKYFISNCGRVKSYCGYTAKILLQDKTKNGYLSVKINGKNIFIHRLVAFAFCDNKHKGENVQIHHKDTNKTNNNYKNLEILTVQEHKERHSKKGTSRQ